MSDMAVSGRSGSPVCGGECPAGEAAGSARSSDSLAGAREAADSESRTILEAMQEAREQAEKRRDQFRVRKNTDYGSAAMMAYGRLARARSPAEAGAAGGYARRRAAQLQAAKRQDPDHARQIQAAIDQLQKAARRASKKKTELTQEQLQEVRRKKLLEQKKKRKAARLRQQLVRKRTQRSIRESGYFRETVIENCFQAQMTATEMELRQQVRDLSAATETAVSAQDTLIAQYATAADATPAPAPEITVQA